jgi:hypothetical protein
MTCASPTSLFAVSPSALLPCWFARSLRSQPPALSRRPSPNISFKRTRYAALCRLIPALDHAKNRPMFSIFYRLLSTDFRVPNSKILSARAQASVLFSRAFHRLANTNFCASHRVLLSGFGLPFVANSNSRAPNGGFSSVQTQTSAPFFRAVPLQFAPRGLKTLYTIADHRLTSRSRGTRRTRRVPELQR